MFLVSTFVASQGVLYSFVGCEIHSMGRTCPALLLALYSCCEGGKHEPAPSTTLDSPLHSDLKPSTLEIVTMAFDMPVYMAAGDGLTICMRVYSCVSDSLSGGARAE